MNLEAELAAFNLVDLERQITREHLWPMLISLGVENPENFFVVFDIRTVPAFGDHS